jgi:hypothetical protein
VELVLIVLAVAVVLAAALALAAVLAAGRSDRVRDAGRFERAAIWEAGYTPADLHLLAGMAAVARAELDAGEIEVVLAHSGGSGDGVVVTGCRLPPGRLGSRVPRGEGLAGRGLVAGRTTLAGLGGPAEAEPSDGLVGVAVPIASGGDVVGVVTATVAQGDRLFNGWHVQRLEAFAANAGRHLGPRTAASGAHRDAG